MRNLARATLALLMLVLVVFWISRTGPSAPRRLAPPLVPPTVTASLGSLATSDHPDSVPAKSTTSLQPPGLLSRNDGSQPAEVKYTLRDHNASVFFTETGITAALFRNGQGLAVRQLFVGSSGASLVEGEATAAIVNTYVGDPSQWKPGQKTVRDLRYCNVWPRIDVVYEPRPGALEYTVHVKPGGDTSAIRFSYEGVDALHVDESGELRLQTVLGDLKETRPVAWQQTAHGIEPVSSRFRLLGDRTYGIEVDAYDRTLALVIDPALSYSTYVGGGHGSSTTWMMSSGNSLVTDAAGNVFVVGTTLSDFPTTPGAYLPALPSGSGGMFVCKILPDGTALAWSTLIAGGSPTINKCAIDAGGNVVIGGFVSVAGFPTTPGAIQSTLIGFHDGFLVKVASGGGSLVFSTLFGGATDDRIVALAVDSSGLIYVSGTTDSTDFTTTPGAYQAAGASYGSFIARFSATGALEWSTMFGGGFGGQVWDMAVDSMGRTYVVGNGAANGFPITPGAWDSTWHSQNGTFLLQMNSTGTALGWSTYVGDAVAAFGLAVDSSFNVYVTGWALTGYYISPGALETTATTSAMFATKFSAGGGSVVWSTFIGGSATTYGKIRILVNGSGEATILGGTYNDGFPTSGGAPQPARAGDVDMVVCRLNSSGTGLLWSTYLGGSGKETAGDIGQDSAGNVYVAGTTESANFPTTPGALVPTPTGGTQSRAFITRIDAAGTALDWSTLLVGGLGEAPGAVATDASGNLYVAGYSYSENYPTTLGAILSTRPSAWSGVVTKFNGNTLLWSTYFGGTNGGSVCGALAVDGTGSVYVGGSTNTANFPTTLGAYQQAYQGGDDAFVAKFSPVGALLWSTLIGGSGQEILSSLVLGPSGDVFVCGDTNSTNFPTSAGVWSTSLQGGRDGYALRLNAAGTALVWSTYFGGTGDDLPYGLAVDAAGSAYVTGQTNSGDLPVSPAAYDTSYNGGLDVFVARILSGGTRGWATFLGGSGSDSARGIALDSSLNVCITGSAQAGFPTTLGAYDTNLSGTVDAFVAKVKADGSDLVWSSFLGGTNSQGSDAIAIDATGSILVAGATFSTDFPTTAGAFQVTLAGSGDAFASQLSSDGSSLLWSTYLGGTSLDRVLKVTIDPFGNFVVAGFTQSPDFPTTVDGVQTSYGGGNDIFVARFGNAGPPTPGGGGGGGGGGGCGLIGLDGLIVALALLRLGRSAKVLRMERSFSRSR